ncbi:MAG: hypothetical protein ACFE9Q_07340 [Candidatus Hodarchaeota archaeon]
MRLEYYNIFTLTPWDNLETNKLTQIRVLSLKSVFKRFPVIEPVFFEDLSSKVNTNYQYSWIESIKRVTGPKNEDYDTTHFNFLWAFDVQNRMFQFLFQKEDTQGILAGLAPPELAKLFTKYGKEAILRTLSLLNDPSKIKFLMILAAKGKSIAQERQLFQLNKKQYNKIKFIDTLKSQPNISGIWYPSYEPRCPICNELLMDLSGLDFRVALRQLICPRCGYKKNA